MMASATRTCLGVSKSRSQSIAKALPRKTAITGTRTPKYLRVARPDRSMADLPVVKRTLHGSPAQECQVHFTCGDGGRPSGGLVARRDVFGPLGHALLPANMVEEAGEQI